MFLRLGRRDVPLRLIVLVVAGMALIAFGLTLAIVWPERDADTEYRDGSAGGKLPVSLFDPDDLYVPDELRVAEPNWVPYRARRDRWTADDAAEHWIDPRETGLDVLSREAEHTILRMLEDVP